MATSCGMSMIEPDRAHGMEIYGKKQHHLYVDCDEMLY